MAYQPKSYRKLLASSVTAAVVASAFAGTAGAASNADQWTADKEAAFSYYVKADVLSPIADFNAEVTRADAAKFYAQALNLPVGNTTTEFSDLPESNWANEYVAALVDAGIINGYEDGTFRPDRVLTRAEAAKVLAAAYGLELNADSAAKFEDVKAWAAPYVGALVDAGLTEGVSATQYGVDQNLTLAQTAVFAKRAVDAGLKSPAAVPTVTDVKVVDANTLEVTLSDETTNEVKLDKALEANVATDVTFTINGNEYAENVNYVVLYPEVENVNAANKVQIKVAFSQQVDKKTAEDVSNYKLNNRVLLDSGSTTTDASAKLQEDGKTVILTAGTTGGFTTSSLNKNTGYALKVSNVKAALVDYVVPDVTKLFDYNDTVAPSVVSAESKAASVTRTVTVKFDEPVKGTGVYKVDGQVASASIGSGTFNNTVTLTTAQNLTVGKTYSVEVLSETDVEGNLVNPNPSTASFSVVGDSSAQGISSTEVLGDDTVRVTFGEKMNASTLTGSTNIKLLDGNGVNLVSRGATVAIAPTSGDTTGTKYDVTVTGAKNLFNANKQLPVTLVVTNSVKDLSGNALTPESRAINFVLDETKPSVTKVDYVKAGATYDGSTKTNGAVVLTFSEDLNTLPLTLSTSDYVAITDGGADETARVGALNASFKGTSKNVVILEPATTFGGTNTETIRLNADIFTDLSNGQNKNAAAVLSVQLKDGITDADTTKPTVSNAVGNNTNNTIKVTFGESISNLESNTVTDVNNYRLDGKPLPSGTYITVNGADATVNLPAGSVSETRGNYSLLVFGVKDKANNVMDAYSNNSISLKDDVKPELKNVTLNTDGSATLAYSEALTTGAATSDLIVTLNGTTLTGTTVAYNVTAVTVGADKGKDVLTVKTLVDKGANAAYGGGDDTLFIDADGDGALSNGDITITSNGNFTASEDGGNFNLNDASTLKVSTVATPTTGADADSNKIKGSTVITVK